MEIVPSLFGLALAWLLWCYSRLQNAQRQTQDGLARLSARLKSRRAAVPALVECVATHLPAERKLLDALMRECRPAAGNQPWADTCRAERQLGRDLGRLVGLVRSYPRLRSDSQFCDQIAKLVEIEDQIQFSRDYYNSAVQILNSTIDSFPASAIANLLFITKAEAAELETACDSLPPVVGDALRARYRSLIGKRQAIECSP